jgi:hypothetical protein
MRKSLESTVNPQAQFDARGGAAVLDFFQNVCGRASDKTSTTATL